jgi:GNAT superfamily N-acetyltransferase
MEWTKEDFSISTDKTKIDVNYVHQFLRKTYWAKNIPFDVVRGSIEGSLCFGVYHHHKQMGFARVITDEATFAYLCDVFIDETYRGQRLSKWLMETILNYDGLKGLRRFMLATKDAHGLYEQFGFVPLTMPERWMHVHQPDVYKKNS